MLSGDCMLLYNMFFMLLNGDYLLGNRIDFAPTGSLVHFRHLGNIYSAVENTAKLSVAWLPFIQHPVHAKYFTRKTSGH